jgi:hypothetical protein
MAHSRWEVALGPTLNCDSGGEGKSSGICVQFGSKAENVLGQFNLIATTSQLADQALNCSTNSGHRTMERASIDPNSDHEKPTRSPDIKPSVGPEA